jgi:hypothetical protein
MACSTCGGRRNTSAADTAVYVVTYPDGSTKDVSSLHAAKVEVVRYPGATFAAK